MSVTRSTIWNQRTHIYYIALLSFKLKDGISLSKIPRVYVLNIKLMTDDLTENQTRATLYIVFDNVILCQLGTFFGLGLRVSTFRSML